MEKRKIPTAVYAEMTPNPAVMKFVVDRTLITGGQQVQYVSKQSAAGSSPLAEELFNFPFVTNVFISGNFVSVTKDDSLGWEMIVQQLREYVREWLMDNQHAVTAVPEEVIATPDTIVIPQAKSESTPSTLSAEDILPSEFDEKIKQLLDDFVRPAVEQDGGAIDFLTYKEGKVYVTMRGACSGCPSSMQTLKGGIENLLKTHIQEVEEVVAFEG